MKKLALLFVIFTVVINCYAQDFPKTPAGQRAEEIVELLNGTSSYDIEDYVKNHFAPQFRDAFPMEQHTGLLTSLTAMHGKLTLARIERTSDHAIEFIAKPQTGGRWPKFMIDVEPSEPHRIARMGVMPVGPLADSPGSEDSSDKSPPADQNASREVPFSTFGEMDSYLLKQTEQNEFSGVVLAARDGKDIFKQAYGFASKNYGVPNRTDTKFNLGSLNKIFTSAAIAQLAAQGKLDFSDNIGKYLKGFPPDAAEKVTISHLLQMRSGWGDYWDNETFLAKKSDLRMVSDYLEFLKDVPLQFEPGTQMIHSNTSFMVLGAIIEAVSGQDYFEYVQENIFDPAGMSNADPRGARDAPVNNVATGYTNMNPHDPDNTGHQWSNIYMIAATGTPAGGGYATADDLLAFDLAMRSYRLMDAQYTNFFYNRFQGTVDSVVPPTRPMGFAGGAPGVNTFFAVDLKDGYTVIVLSNYDMPAAMTIGQAIIEMLGLK